MMAAMFIVAAVLTLLAVFSKVEANAQQRYRKRARKRFAKALKGGGK